MTDLTIDENASGLVPANGLREVHQNGDAAHEQFTDDSEAETEILNPSRNNTPIKRGMLVKQRRNDRGYSPERRASVQSHPVVSEHVSRLSDSESTSERKRKLSEGKYAQATVSVVKRLRATINASPSLIGRDSPNGDGEDEDGVQVRRRRTSSESQTRKAHTRSKSVMKDVEGNGEVEANIRYAPERPPHVPKREPGLHENSSTSANYHRRSPSSSPVHRRSSSFHQPLSSKHDFEQKSRTRWPSHDDDFLPPPEIYFARRKRHSVRSTLSPSTAHTMASRGEKRDRAGRSPLAQACAENNLEKFNRIFISSTADMEKTDNTGNTPLQIAALDGATEIVKILIDAGASIHCKNSDKDTPLIDAVENSHVDVIKILLEAGVDPRITNLNGKQPLELIPKDSEQHDMIKQLLTTAIKDYQSPPRQSGSPATSSDVVASTANSLLYVQPTLENLLRFCKKGDDVGAEHMLRCYIKADNSCMVAAARGGHTKVLSTLIYFGGCVDPAPMSQDDDTPMLSAIGRGHLKIIEFLLQQEDFDARRKLSGARPTSRYHTLARARKGPHCVEEAEMLWVAYKKAKAAADPPEPLTDDEEEVEAAPASLPAAVSKADTRPGIVPAVEEAAVTVAEEAGPMVAGGVPSEPKRRRLMTGHERSELRAQEEKARQEYLDSLPWVLRRTLGKHIQYNRAVPWMKSIQQFNPIVCVELVDIDPSCPEGRAGELWLMNFQAALFLAHPRLDTAELDLGWETRPCPEEHREAMLRANITVADSLNLDFLIVEATNEQIEATGYPYKAHPFKPTAAHLVQNMVNWKNVEKPKFMGLPASQIYWVPLDTFITATVAPDMNDRYKTYTFWTQVEQIHKSDRIPVTKSFLDGVMISERPSQIPPNPRVDSRFH